MFQSKVVCDLETWFRKQTVPGQDIYINITRNVGNINVIDEYVR